MNEEEILRKLDKLEQLSETDALDLLVDLLEQGTPFAREIAFEKLKKLRVSRASRKIAQLLRADDAYLRNAATLLLADLWDLSRDVLRELVQDKDKDVRKLALDALHYVADDPLVIDIIAEALRDEDINNVIAAVEYIGDLGGEKYKGQILDLFLQSKDEFLTCACLNTLANIGDEECARKIVNSFQNIEEIDDTVFISLLRLMKSFPQIIDINKMIKISLNKWKIALKEVLDLLSVYIAEDLIVDEQQKATVGEFLKRLTLSEIPSANKYEAVMLLSKLDPVFTRKELVNYLYSDDPMIQIAAVELIGQMNLKEFTEDIEKIASESEDEDLKLAAIYTLNQLRGE
ncbi:HEAT repeat domain-containing protein [Pseudothermotoga sp. U03pept]|uniref:HEAT repeat domain-containing protein n=1 Tax=Pseudothermotoga sp. U03pept TaxID=3447012 RepID=UPI003EFCBBDB